MEQSKIIYEIEDNNYIMNEKDPIYYLMLKRWIDFLFALFGIIVLLPLFLIISIFYLYGQNKGPIFFTQNRLGKNGKVFKIYKYRTMVVDAEKRLKSDDLLYKIYVKNGYKLEPFEDPRITNLGKFLRKTSLDEIPQLINVLKGEMSLVGPRPIVENELKEYKNQKDSFLSVKPGLTGYWQVSGRSDVNYPERVDIELYYVQNKSLLFDLKIFCKTFLTVILQKGAY